MKIFITTPTFGLNGGIRNIIELANHLQLLGHEVVLYNQGGHLRSPHYEFKCRVVNSTNLLDRSDRLIVSSPHAVDLMGRVPTISWVQMIEEKFRPGDQGWLAKCEKWYNESNFSIYTATWGKDERGHIFDWILPTGMNLKHFPISTKPKDGKTILLESPEPNNPAKDVEFKALTVAGLLKEMGYYIIAYGANPLKSRLKWVPHEYYPAPTLARINNLYERATILLKATKYDFRSVSCLEAMTKGTVTVRAIEKGDEDLTEDLAYKIGYDGNLLELALSALNDPNLPQKAENCRYFIQEKSWDKVAKQYEELICK